MSERYTVGFYNRLQDRGYAAEYLASCADNQAAFVQAISDIAKVHNIPAPSEPPAAQGDAVDHLEWFTAIVLPRLSAINVAIGRELAEPSSQQFLGTADLVALATLLDAAPALIHELEALRVRNAELEAALEVYADPRNFAEGNDWVWVGDDNPTRYAREVLDAARASEGKS